MASIQSLWLISSVDNYAPAFYWSIIETNVGILSACLPTIRPLLEAYPLTSFFTKPTKYLSGIFQSIMRSSIDVRLDSMEHGLTEAEGEALGVRHHKTCALYDGSGIPPQDTVATVYTRKLSQTWYRDGSQSSKGDYD